MKINKDILNEMLSSQKEIDNLVIEKHNLQGVDLTQNKYIALNTELHELINEIEEFKHWKVNKGKEHILEEGIDCIHFILSLMNDVEFTFEEDLILTEEQQKFMDEKTINEIYIMTNISITDAYIMNVWKDSLCAILLGILVILQKCNYYEKDIIKEYMRKNQINIERQKSNY